MTDHKPITDWHRQRAADLANESGDVNWIAADFCGLANSLVRAFVQHIADHEDPPVDPDLIAAREIVAKRSEARGAKDLARRFRKGVYDGSTEIGDILEGIRYVRANP